jgi:hypothetical protein
MQPQPREAYFSATCSTSLPKFSPLKSLSSVSGRCRSGDDVFLALHAPVLQVARELLDGDREALGVVEHDDAFHARAVHEQREVFFGPAPASCCCTG